MKTIIRKVNFRYFFRGSLYLLIISFLLAGCEEEASLSARSVVEAGETERERTELDKWILDTFTRPYGIEVEYRWDKNAVQNGSYIYPPEVANVKSVLNTIKTLWIDLYTAPELGGDKFLLGKNPLKIYMYGGRNPTVIIYRSDKEYLLSIIYVSETTKQASPATYEIQQDGSQYFIAPASKRLYVDYDPAKDVLNISSLGHYLRN